MFLTNIFKRYSILESVYFVEYDGCGGTVDCILGFVFTECELSLVKVLQSMTKNSSATLIHNNNLSFTEQFEGFNLVSRFSILISQVLALVNSLATIKPFH